MYAALAALASCTIAPRPLDATGGRLMFDNTLYPYGALKEFCDPDDCLLGPDGQPLTGLGIGIRELDQTTSQEPPGSLGDGCYTTPLRVDSNNCIWIKWQPPQYWTSRTYEQTSYFWRGLDSETRSDLGSPATHSIKNESCDRCRVLRRVRVANAALVDPRREDGGAIGLDGGISPADMVIELKDVNGTEVYDIVRTARGGSATTTTMFDFNPVYVDPGETYTFSVQPQLYIRRNATERFDILRGEIKMSLKLECPLTGETLDETMDG